MLASNGGHRDCTELLLSCKASPNQQDQVTRGEGWEVAHVVVGDGTYCCVGVAVWIIEFGRVKAELMCRLRLY